MMEERPDNMSSHLSCQLARAVCWAVRQPSMDITRPFSGKRCLVDQLLRNASIGLMDDARRAGTYPEASATSKSAVAIPR